MKSLAPESMHLATPVNTLALLMMRLRFMGTKKRVHNYTASKWWSQILIPTTWISQPRYHQSSCEFNPEVAKQTLDSSPSLRAKDKREAIDSLQTDSPTKVVTSKNVSRYGQMSLGVRRSKLTCVDN